MLLILVVLARLSLRSLITSTPLALLLAVHLLHSLDLLVGQAVLELVQPRRLGWPLAPPADLLAPRRQPMMALRLQRPPNYAISDCLGLCHRPVVQRFRWF